ncbi:MAG: alpha/beta hydrolase [Rhizobiales bacterium]|nr:alpha/beta hydrolase [Hyphomicrobiales bacterium]
MDALDPQCRTREPGGTPLAESIANAIIPGIRQLAGGDTVTLVGFSFGGVVCGVIGQLAPDLVDSIVFVGAAGLGLPREPLDLKSWRLTGTAEGRRMLHRHNVRELMIWNDDRIDDLAVYLQQSNAERTRFRSRKIARTTVLRHALEASSGPIAGIWGEHDATAAPYIDERRELLQELRPGTPFTVMPGMGHWVMYEAADDFNPLLLRMIETIKPRV